MHAKHTHIRARARFPSVSRVLSSAARHSACAFCIHSVFPAVYSSRKRGNREMRDRFRAERSDDTTVNPCFTAIWIHVHARASRSPANRDTHTYTRRYMYAYTSRTSHTHTHTYRVILTSQRQRCCTCVIRDACIVERLESPNRMTRVQLGRFWGGEPWYPLLDVYPLLSWPARWVFSGSCRGRYQRVLGYAIREKKWMEIERVDRVVSDSQIFGTRSRIWDNDCGEKKNWYTGFRLTSRTMCERSLLDVDRRLDNWI